MSTAHDRDGSIAPVPAAPPPRYRLSDQERSEAISALTDAYAEGRLDTDEFRERMSAASEARFAADLDPLFADLPQRTPTFRQPRSPQPLPSMRDHGGPSQHRRHPGAGSHDRLNPMVFMPLIVLIVATTHLWFFIPLLFVTLSMVGRTSRGSSSRRRIAPSAIRGTHHQPCRGGWR